ncbi:ArsR family transcriptional regulator [Candidatus Bathyarchaeota archaeon]|nr:ArsR family transcriptional regulator [Candidatus Bathyarchaeota archaeon]
MDNDHADKLKKNTVEIVKVLNALSNETRLSVLSLLLDGEKQLKYLLEETGQSKNGLVNHLSTLIDTGIVERVSWGKYTITKDGAGYIRDIVDQYLSSEKFRSKRRKIDTSMYQWRTKKLNERIVSSPAEFKPSLFSYQGAVQGVLEARGKKVSLDEVIAVSGYGWITNAMKKHLCPSVPSAFHKEVWSAIHKSTENLGYKVNLISSGLFEWDEKQTPTEESVKNAEKQYQAAKQVIDNDRPLIMWGLPIPEYGIVNGYRGEEYIVSTYRRLIEQQDTPIHYTGLMAPGGLHCIDLTTLTMLDPKTVAIETLKLGYRLGVGDTPQIDAYTLGSEAYDVLAGNLKGEEFDENSHHGTGYTLACLMEAKWGLSEYLKKADTLLDVDLSDITSRYNELYLLLKKCHEEFPLGPGEMPPYKCEKVAGLLREGKKIESEALERIKEALTML